MSNQIKNKTSDPFIQEFATNDLFVNINEGTLFYRSKNELFRVEGRKVETFASDFGGQTVVSELRPISASIISTSGFIIGEDYSLHLSSAFSDDIPSGTHPFATTNVGSSDDNMYLGWVNSGLTGLITFGFSGVNAFLNTVNDSIHGTLNLCGPSGINFITKQGTFLADLKVHRDITSSGRFDSTNDNFVFNGGNNNQVMFVQSNDADVFIDLEDSNTTNNVLIGAKGDDIYLRTDAGGGGFHFESLNNANTGNVMFYNTSTHEITYASSTRKIKKNIINIPTEGLLESFNKIKPRKFTYRNNDEEDYGFIAEEISEVDPLLAVWGKDFAYDEKGKKIQLPKKTNDKLEEPTYKLDSSNKVPIDINDRSLLAVAIAKIQELEQRIKKIENERSL